ncbi:MAG: hypothetical protein INQ03_22845 [Candidatus Heimdallarchaeota archaeon]|nr:hypothetical protein [Candidatus Heimdallarchaeota archaeon]
MADLFTLDILSILLLLITGVVALLVGIILIKEYIAKKSFGHFFIAVGYLVLFVSGVLIIILGFEVLKEPIIPPVAALIPVGIATGILFFKFEEKPLIPWVFFGYEIVMIIITLIVRLGGNTDSAGLVMAMHIPSGLIIFFLPLFTGQNKAWFITLGGGLISFGGMLLAFAGSGNPLFGIFDYDMIFAVLPLLLLIVGVCFTLGLIFPEKWRIAVPVLSPMLIKE